MKKLIFLASMVAALFLAGSCQRENLEPVEQGGTVTYTVQVPGALATKAANGYELIYEVYRQDNTLVYESKTPIAFDQTGKVELSLEFVKDQTFTVLFWAQNSGCTAYDVKDLRAVSLANNLKANDENAEAFAGKDVVTNCVSAAENGNVVLVRPIAQLNIATLTESLSLGVTGSTTSPVNPEYVEVAVNGLYTTYNVATGDVANETNVSYTKAEIPANDTFNTDYIRLGMNYIGFIPSAGDNVVVDFTIYTQNDGNIEHTVSNVPVKPNYQTNILGNLISATADYSVTLEGWAKPDYNVEVVTVSTAQDLQDAINNIQDGASGNIQLEGNIDLGALAGLVSTKAEPNPYGLLIPAGKSLTLDLNGKSLTWTSSNQNNWMIENNGSLSLVGAGNVVYNYEGVNDPAYGKGNYTITNKGTLVIDGPTVSIKVKGQNNVKYPHALYVVQNSGKLTLESGKIENCHNQAVRQWIGSETEASEIVVNGGEIYGLRAIWMQLPNNKPEFAPKGVLNVNGGKLSAWENADEYDSENKLAVYSYSYGNQMKNVEINVTGGEINGDIALTGGTNKASVEKVTITGGTFNGFNGDLYSYADDALAAPAITIKGGQFSSLYPMAYLDAADEEFNFVMTEDMTISEKILIKNNFTFDGNGYTLTYTGSDRAIDVYLENPDYREVTLKNITINCTASYCQRGVNFNIPGKFNVDNVTVGGTNVTYAFNMPVSSSNSEITINNSNLTGNIALNVWGQDCVINASNSVFTSVDNSEAEGYNAIVLNNSIDYIADGTVVNIVGGKIIATNEKGEPSTAISNNTNTGIVNVSKTTEVVGKIEESVAVVTYDGYNEFYSHTTLQDAIDKASESPVETTTVALIKDITLAESITITKDQNVKINLNGHKIAYAVANDGKASAVIVNYGTLSIFNSDENESIITFTAADPDMTAIPSYATNTITNEGSLTIGTNVTVENHSNGGASYAVDDKGVFTLNGGTLKGNNCALRIAKFNQDNVKFVMNDGLIVAKKPAWIHLPGSDSAYAPTITVEINAGTFQSTLVSSADNNIFYTYSFGNSHRNTKITVNGGEFLGGTVSIGSGYKGDIPTLNITGGTFEYDVLQWLKNDEVQVLFSANK